MSLHPQSKALLDLVYRAEAVPFETMTLGQQRASAAAMQHAFRPPMPEVGSAEEGVLPRPDSLGGPLRYRLYRPKEAHPDTRLPALIYVHGGGWTVGNIESYEVVCRELANGSGCAVLALAYRLAPEHPFPAAVEDVSHAVRWLSTHGASIGLDGSRLAIGGDSAGGNLSTVAALIARDEGISSLKLQLLVYPSTDQRGMTPSHTTYGDGYLLNQASIVRFQQCYLPREEDKLDWRASPILAPSLEGLPPVLMITASHDPLIDDCEAYARRLQASGVPVTYSRYEGMLHAFFTLGKFFPDANKAVAEAAEAIAKALL